MGVFNVAHFSASTTFRNAHRSRVVDPVEVTSLAPQASPSEQAIGICVVLEVRNVCPTSILQSVRTVNQHTTLEAV